MPKRKVSISSGKDVFLFHQSVELFLQMITISPDNEDFHPANVFIPLHQISLTIAS